MKQCLRIQKMNEEKRGIGKAKIGLVISIILVVILAITNVWSYTNQQNQINTLSNEKNNLQNQVNILQSQNNTLQTWLNGNVSLLQTTIAERDQLQTWLNGNITNYESQISSLNSQIASLQNQIDSLNSQISSLNSQIDSLNAQITNLQNQINTLEAPKLILVNLRADDNRPIFGTPYLHVYGEVCNVGTNTAYDCKLHVVAYQSGGVVAIDTYITLGTIDGESWVSVDTNVYYSGDALTSWTVTAEWTS